ncbi:MAG TPA: acyl-CoA dehydrogenase family protein [Smithellaceae bacterium]|nr:acyl-CoA dehydrogenase family protein [Smithellaceae bacterium]HNT91471.1 acyl-CoA dehydrogenase family protein [Smithellaceae bacterium]HNV64361.1 acyl-CoA dehydrogenase family protein [Smithellaceae bacterium]HNZ31561.1 acyl-CoA dehydrogenase family protein [Smithellaceae bacterium]HOD31138.1 acyl-CoA dehydrogenase family protein [Smithellaceae bacterium]
MPYNPSVKHKLIRDSVRHFAETELASIAAEIDRNAVFPVEVIDKMKKLNYFGLQVPKEFGGAALDSVSAAIVVEEISRVCAAVGLCVTVHNGVAVFPFLQFGNKRQNEKYLPRLASGEMIGAFSLTEANAGSDAGSVETTAVKNGNDYVLNGTKIFVSNGGVCNLALIFALTNTDQKQLQSSVFIVESAYEGFLRGELEDLCGMRANPVSSLFLENCRVPEENILGKLGMGMKIGMTTLDNGRIGVAAQALGIAQGAFEAAVKYAKERQQFKKPIASLQTIQNYIADMATEQAAARLLLYRACELKDAGEPYGCEAAMAKLYCSSLASKTTSLAVQVHGGYGYSKEYDVERYFRDAKVTEIYEGTSEIQRMVIARAILAKLTL